MKISHLLLSACATVMIATASANAAVIYDAVNDFSITANPNGVWAYGSGIGGASFTRLPSAITDGGFSGYSAFEFWQAANPVFEVPLVAKNTGSTTLNFSSLVSPANVLVIHPGVSSDVIVQWTAPTTSTYKYSGLYELLDTNPSGVIGQIFASNSAVPIYTGALAAPGASHATSSPGQSEIFGGFVNLHQGDTLSFVVNNGGLFYNDSTGFNATISAVPEPAAWGIMLLGFGAVGWTLRGNRRRRTAVA